MTNQIIYKNFYITVILILISFSVNFYVGSNGVFTVDTFIHYDNGFRILLGEHPVKDYWIVHGFIIDYIQALFFKVFGNNWYAYLIHSSVFNVTITLFSFYIFKLLKVNLYLAFLVSICIALLAYPVSGTPFLDLHSSFFSLFGIYFAIIAIVKDKNSYWFWTSFFLCLAFFSKQVPAAYTIIGISFINLFVSINKKKLSIFIYFVSGATIFLILLFVFLTIKQISIEDFIIQIFLFPQSIGASRYETYDLNFKNVVWDYKFIYFVYIIILAINMAQIISNKDFCNSKHFKIFLVLTIFFGTLLLHQVHTQNQIYIFFLVPVLTGFALYYKNFLKIKNKSFITYFILLFCVIVTFKYNERFSIERKFHELSNVDLSNSKSFETFDKKFRGLNWITPYFNEPDIEINNLKILKEILRLQTDNTMLLTEYNFFSSTLERKFHSPSRTFDRISYPRLNSKYYFKYKNFLIDKIKKEKIKNIFVLEWREISTRRLNHLILNYVSKDCFQVSKTNIYIVKLKVKSCEDLL